MKKQLWIYLIAILLLATPIVCEKKQVKILCYHTFLGKETIQTDFSISEFRTQITTLRTRGFTFVKWSDVINGQITGTKNILIVIDDGNISTFKAYQYVLKPYAIKPLIAIYPGIIDTRKFALTWAQIKSMQADGCEIASHGYYHMYLTQQYASQHPNEFNDEIYRSKSVLEKKLATSIVAFVYPFGVTSPIAFQELKKAGYQYAFSLRQAPLTLPVSKIEALDIPRYMITKSQQKEIFKKLTK